VRVSASKKERIMRRSSATRQPKTSSALAAAQVVKRWLPLACVSFLALTGCETVTSVQKTAHREVAGNDQYIPVDPVKLANEAFLDDYKGKRVVFECDFFKVGDRVMVEEYKKGWIQFVATTGANRQMLYTNCNLLVRKEQSEPLFGLKNASLLKVYGRVKAGSSRRRRSAIVEVERFEVLKNQSLLEKNLAKQTSGD
jgi:hypothetical protein